jgi:hypothetical protein
LKHTKIKASKLKKVFQMTEKQSTLKAIKARVGKQSKRNFSKQSFREMPRICRLLEEAKEESYGHTNATRSEIR